MKLNTLFKYSKRSVVNTWLISYLLVLIVPVIISIVAYFSAQEIVKQKIVEYNKLLMGYIMKEVDKTVNENIRISSFFSTHERIANAQGITLPLSAENQYEFFEIQRDIKSFLTSFYTESSFYIYLKNSDIIISRDHVLSSKDYFAYFCANTISISYTEWKKSMTEPQTPYIWAIKYNHKNSDDSTENVLMSINQFPVDSAEKTGAVVVQSLDLGIRKILLEGEKNAQSEYAIFDNANRLLLASSNILSLDYKSIERVEEGDEYIFNGDKYVVQKDISKSTGIKYVTLISHKKLWKKMHMMRVISLDLMLIGIFLGVIVIVYFIRRNYSPLKGMLDAIKNHESTETFFEVNEFEIIDRTMQRLKQKNIDIQSRLESQTEQLKESFLERLIKGQVVENDSVMEELLDAYSINLPSDKFSVLSFYIEDFSELFKGDKKTKLSEQLKLVHYVIKNVTEELAAANGNIGYFALVGDIPVMLVCFSKRDDKYSYIDELNLLASKVKGFLKENLQLKMTISVSNTHRTIAGIAIAYKEAISAMEYKLILGEESIINFGGINKKCANDEYSYTYEQEQLLVNYIKTNNYELASKLVDDIFYECFKNNVPQLNLARCLAFDMVGTLMKMRDELGGSIATEGIFDIQDVIGGLFTWQTVEGLKKVMLEVIEKFCCYCNQKQDIKIKNMVNDFVRKNYTNANLSLAYVAESLKLNNCYLSTMYKEQAGEGLLEYINRFRIQKSKELLISDLDNIETIATKVGYSNSKTFIRVFKKYEGVTPGKYRES